MDEKRELLDEKGLPLEIELTLENVSKLPITYTVSDDGTNYKEHDLGMNHREDKKFFETFKDVTLSWSGSLEGTRINPRPNELKESIIIECGDYFDLHEWEEIVEKMAVEE